MIPFDRQNINFAHIMPADYLSTIGTLSRCELVLAHVAKEDHVYADWFHNNPTITSFRGQYIHIKRIMDNGAFELGASMNPEELIEIGHYVKATHLVLPDYPGESSEKTIKAAMEWAPKFKKAGFKTIFVPQGKVGDLNDFDNAMKFAVEHAAYGAPLIKNDLITATAQALNSDKYIDQIALSIIGVPNAYGVYKNKTQRLLARWHYLSALPQRNWYIHSSLRNIPIHMLGLLDGINEIEVISTLQREGRASTSTGIRDYNIESWDSSAAVWYAHNGFHVDDGSPTGRADGKFELEVDFGAVATDETIRKAMENINYIDVMCGHSPQVTKSRI